MINPQNLVKGLDAISEEEENNTEIAERIHQLGNDLRAEQLERERQQKEEQERQRQLEEQRKRQTEQDKQMKMMGIGIIELANHNSFQDNIAHLTQQFNSIELAPSTRDTTTVDLTPLIDTKGTLSHIQKSI